MTFKEYPSSWPRELILAIQDLKAGKRKAEKRLYKFVEDETINKYTYQELIEKHRKTKERKENLFCCLIKEYSPYLIAFSFIGALCILGSSITIKNTFWVWLSALFLIICALNVYTETFGYKKDLYEKVAWIVEKQKGDLPPPHLRDSELMLYIELEQREQNNPEQFRIDFYNETENIYLLQILNDHREHVIKQYFYNWLKTSEDFYKLTPLEYYFFALKCFISGNLCKDNVYDGYKIEDVSEHEYKRKLSEYGRVYYKLLLIVRLYAEANEKVRKLHNYIDKEENLRIMKILDTNEEVFWK